MTTCLGRGLQVVDIHRYRTHPHSRLSVLRLSAYATGQPISCSSPEEKPAEVEHGFEGKCTDPFSMPLPTSWVGLLLVGAIAKHRKEVHEHLCRGASASCLISFLFESRHIWLWSSFLDLERVRQRKCLGSSSLMVTTKQREEWEWEMKVGLQEIPPFHLFHSCSTS